MGIALRIAAVCVLLAALVLPRRAAYERVMVLVLQGARCSNVDAFAPTGRVLALEQLCSRERGGDLVGAGESRSSDAVLSEVLAYPAANFLDPLPVPAQRFVWEELEAAGRPYVVIGVAGLEPSMDRAGIILPGPAPARGFLGSNTGLVASVRIIKRGEVAWPYSAALPQLRSALSDLEPAGMTRWVEIGEGAAIDARAGVARAYALDDDTVFLTPVYTRSVAADVLGTAEVEVGDRFVADDPSAVALSSRADEYLLRHVANLADTRAEYARALARSKNWDLFVYVDRRIAIAEIQGHEGGGSGDLSATVDADVPAAGVSEQLVDAYAGVNAVVEGLMHIAGENTAVLVLGIHGPPAGGATEVGWFAMDRDEPPADGAAAAVGDLSATLHHLLGLRLATDQKPIAAVVARYSTGRVARVGPVVNSHPGAVPLSAATLSRLTEAEKTLQAENSQP